MNSERIRELMESVPGSVPLYRNTSSHLLDGGSQAEQQDPVGYALLDPQFPWTYASAFAVAGQPLPREVKEDSIWQAYAYRRFNEPDDAVNRANLLRHSNWTTQRQFINAMLIIPDQSLWSVSKYTGVAVPVLEMYERLFWSVRDRLDDVLFMSKLVWPLTRRVLYQPDYFLNESPGLLMLRAARDHGMDGLLVLFGATTTSKEMSLDMVASKLQTKTISESNALAMAGAINQRGLPVQQRAQGLLTAALQGGAQKQDMSDTEAGLTHLSMGGSIINTAVGLLSGDPEHEARCKLQLELLASNASKN